MLSDGIQPFMNASGINAAESPSFLSRRIGQAVERSLKRAYGRFGVSPSRYLEHLRRGHGLPIQTFGDVFGLHPAALDHVAERTIAGSRRIAILEGAGFGFGGALTLLPDVSLLGVITFRLIQKLSLTYGFEYSTEEAKTELWMATASAAGVEVARDWIKKQVIERLMARIAEKAGAELAEKISTPISSPGGVAAPNTTFATTILSAAANWLACRPPRPG
jgi:EcsC protein family